MDNLGWEYSILVFKIGTITAALRPVDVSPAMELFPGEISLLEWVRRPTGEVDLLIGI